jgi:toxin-antitoxin system PIN domain toxin
VILLDINVLLYAFRADAEHHPEYHRWLGDTLRNEAAFGLSPQVLCSVIRISTHPSIYKEPSHTGEAVRFCRLLTSAPNCVLVQPSERHWPIFLDLCLKTGVSGNLTQDAWYAALAIESGSEWITTDRDYARFPGLRWRKPF